MCERLDRLARSRRLRDGDKSRYLGKGVKNAVANVNGAIAQTLKGFDLPKASMETYRPRRTPNKSRLGANALLGVSLANAHAVAASRKQSLWQYLPALSPQPSALGPALPVPMMNIVNGGAHADNNVDMQEFMVLPVGLPNFAEALRAGVEIFHALKSVLKAKGLNTAVGDEGGFAPDLKSNEQAIGDSEAIAKAGYAAGKDVYLGLDVASSEFYKNGAYHLEGEGKVLSPSQLIEFYADWCAKYPIITIEDGMAEGDWDGWKALTERLGGKVQLVGDDLFVTNTAIFKQGIERHIANAILIKVNQIGTLTETLEAIAMAAAATTRRSFRIARARPKTRRSRTSRSRRPRRRSRPVAVPLDRVAKYNQLLRIEESLGAQARYARRSTFPNVQGLVA